MAWGPQPHQISSLALVRGGGGAKLLLRRSFFADTNLVVPAGGNWISARAVGRGADNNGAGQNAGGGGAFARRDRLCVPGQAVAVTINPAAVSLDGLIICSADAANGRNGGLAANCVGDVISPGGNGGAGGGPGAGAAGTNGAPGGTGYQTDPGAGGSGGESNAVDALIYGGAGGSVYTGRGGGGTFPGGGGAYSQFVAFQGFGAPGLVIVEIWSGKP